MKKKLLRLVPALVLAVPLLAQNREAGRVQNAGMVMREILNAPDSIPQSVLDRADCVAILPSVLKFAIGIGGSFGRGVMTCRGGSDFQGPWGAPTMMRLGGRQRGVTARRSGNRFRSAFDVAAFRKEHA
jgi:lipid-binding SYLF domain-containing protein